MEKYRKLYLKQKEKVRGIIQEEKTKYEEKVTKEIIQAKDSGRRMWKIIEKLKGSNKREQEKAIYDQNRKLLQEREAEQAMIRYWKTVYQKVENQMKHKWMEGERDIYVTEKETGEESDLATIVWDGRTREQVAPVEVDGKQQHLC